MSGPGCTILVVEDEPDIRESLAEVLDTEGYRVVGVGDGLEALAWLSGGQRADLILLDLVMPRMSGWAFLERLHADPALARPPVVGMSGARVGDLGRLDAVLLKPFELDELLATVKRLTPTPP